jgi:uncharacterized secreted repeat protein (TIGR03808 family)
MLQNRIAKGTVPLLNRRDALAGAAGLIAAGLSAAGAAPAAGDLPSAADFGVRPDAPDDQNRAFARMLAEASERNIALFLPPGRYIVSNLSLPPRVRLTGVPGATTVLLGGGGPLFTADHAEHIELSGLVFDGAGKQFDQRSKGLLELRAVDHCVIDNCRVAGSGRHGLALEAVAGRISNSIFTGIADAGLYCVEAKGLSITGNTVSDCGDGGILVHRWQAGEDGTLVTGNRIERIGARSGGTGQNGNGINAFRAGNVVISGNMISDCAFSAIRANSASNVQITSNTCLRSGETALYSEFGFQGAVIGNNVVDGAANGISMVNFDEGGRMATCTGNIVRNLKTTAPYVPDGPGFGSGIVAEADAVISGNVVENAPRNGLKIGWGPYLRNVIATANVIRKAGTGIAVSVVDGAGTAIITDNIIEAARDGAIIGYRWATPVTADLASIGNAGYANLTVERNRVS